MNRHYFCGLIVIVTIIVNAFCMTWYQSSARDKEYKQLSKQYNELYESVMHGDANITRNTSVMTVMNNSDYLANIPNWYSNGVITVKNVKIKEWRTFGADKTVESFPIRQFKINDVISIPSQCMLEFEFNGDVYLINKWCQTVNGNNVHGSFLMNGHECRSEKLKNTDIRIKLVCGFTRACTQQDCHKCYIEFIKVKN